MSRISVKKSDENVTIYEQYCKRETQQQATNVDQADEETGPVKSAKMFHM